MMSMYETKENQNYDVTKVKNVDTKVSNLYNSLNDNKSKIIPFKIVLGDVGAM